MGVRAAGAVGRGGRSCRLLPDTCQVRERRRVPDLSGPSRVLPPAAGSRSVNTGTTKSSVCQLLSKTVSHVSRVRIRPPDPQGPPGFSFLGSPRCQEQRKSLLWGLTWGDTIGSVVRVPSGCWGRVKRPECLRGIRDPTEGGHRDSREKQTGGRQVAGPGAWAVSGGHGGSRRFGGPRCPCRPGERPRGHAAG